MTLVPCPQSLAQILAEVVTIAGAIVMAVFVPPTLPLDIPAIVAGVVALTPVIAWAINYLYEWLESKPTISAIPCTEASPARCAANKLGIMAGYLDLGICTTLCLHLTSARLAILNASKAIFHAANLLERQGRLGELDTALAQAGVVAKSQ